MQLQGCLLLNWKSRPWWYQNCGNGVMNHDWSNWVSVEWQVFHFLKGQILWFSTTETRDAKGRKVSGNFGNFPWKVLGIFGNFGNFQFWLIFLHFMKLFVQKSTKLNSFCTNYPRYWFCTSFWSIESTTRLHNEIICDFLYKIKYFVFHVILRISTETPNWKLKKFSRSFILRTWKHQVCYDNTVLIIIRVRFIPINNYVQQLIVVPKNPDIYIKLLIIPSWNSIKIIQTHQFGVFLKGLPTF